MKESISLSSNKQHFLILDGFRGIAALAVVIFHFMEIIISDFSQNIIAHGYLAVDFFFCLSGFVIAYAYDDRMARMSFTAFFKQRIKRLHPLVVLGSTLGLLAFLFAPYSEPSGRYSASEIVVLFVLSALMIPYPVMEDRFFNLFGLNAPSWSLFWEYVASFLYGALLVRLPRKWLLAATILSAFLLVYIANTSGSLIGGWNGETFWHGGGRMLFSFLAGMCAFRYKLILKNKLGFTGLGIVLAATFLLPYRPQLNPVTEPFVVIFIFPALISLGAGVESVGEIEKKVCNFLGNLSYPLYITHYFAMWWFGAYYSKVNPENFTLLAVVSGVFALQILVAWISMKYYDTPLRKKIRF